MSLVIVSDCCVNLEGERIGLVIGGEVKRPWRREGFLSQPNTQTGGSVYLLPPGYLAVGREPRGQRQRI